MKKKYYIGVFEGHYDPAAAIVCDGKVLAYSEEERHTRQKHAVGAYPVKALRYCLETAGISLEDVESIAVNWDLPAFTNGSMNAFFEKLNQEYDVNQGTLSWQKFMLNKFNSEKYTQYHHKQLRKAFGNVALPPIKSFPHHFSHCFQTFYQSPFEQAVCLTLDGSGDQNCTVIWKAEGDKITPIRNIEIPHSLGWVYAAFTEYLGFQAYDGEYKVMGLAAYGQPDSKLSEKVAKIIQWDDIQQTYRIDPSYVHYGEHTYSERFTDKLATLFHRQPRLSCEEITTWHENLAFAVQKRLEEVVVKLTEWAIDKTGISNVCIGGGVGMNVKMNQRIFESSKVSDLFVHPLCSDGGGAQSVALASCHQATGVLPEKLQTLALGYSETNESVQKMLDLVQLDYTYYEDIEDATAEELAQGKIVGWVQGNMEAGPRALGQRSILADPRNTKNRDKVNSIIKFREYWRPFCPSMTYEDVDRFFDAYTDAPYMVVAFKANDHLKEVAPAIVHTDQTARVQMVHQDVLPRYHKLLKRFESRSSIPILLNTSFNVKGEPLVTSAQDALRTFWSTGMDILVIENYMIRKPKLM